MYSQGMIRRKKIYICSLRIQFFESFLKLLYFLNHVGNQQQNQCNMDSVNVVLNSSCPICSYWHDVFQCFGVLTQFIFAVDTVDCIFKERCLITWQRIPEIIEVEKKWKYNLTVWDINFDCIHLRKLKINEVIKSDVKIYIIRFQSQQADIII